MVDIFVFIKKWQDKAGNDVGPSGFEIGEAFNGKWDLMVQGQLAQIGQRKRTTNLVNVVPSFMRQNMQGCQNFVQLRTKTFF